MSKYKFADPLTPKDSSEVRKAFQPIYKRSFEWVKRPPEVVSALNHEVIMWMEKILTMTFTVIIAHGLLKSVRSLTS